MHPKVPRHDVSNDSIPRLHIRSGPHNAWSSNKVRVALKVGASPIKQEDIIREAPVEHFFQAFDADAVLLMRVQGTPIVRDPIHEPASVPSAKKG